MTPGHPDRSRAWCRMEFTYRDQREAEAILRALQPENQEYVKAWLEGNTLFSEAGAENPLALLHTLEDYLACVAVAEGVLRTHKPSPSPDKNMEPRPRR